VSSVSIIMTVYNGERYIEPAIRSILTQTLKDIEFIIVDDGSTDGTKEKIIKVNDPRIKYYPLEHVGRARALNYAVSKAQSSFIAFMDADDIALPERIEKQYLCLQQNPEIGVVSGWYQLMDANGNLLHTIRKLPEQHAEIEYEMTKHSSMCFPATMMRRRLFDVAGGFNEQYKSAIDYEYYLRLMPVARYYNLQNILLHYRIRTDSISTLQKSEQRIHTRDLSRDYLLSILQNNSVSNEQYILKYRLGINEYYNGSMQTARIWFLQAFSKMWMQPSLWRFLLPTLLGDKIFSLYRSHL
jgi:glycosyltransferase involved in cell wall biosynthesis